jgi:ferritin-like metal-binding protein YciE
MKLDEAKSGADFDKAYAADMVSDHKKAVEAFEKAATDATDAEVKAFAVKTLPTLKSISRWLKTFKTTSENSRTASCRHAPFALAPLIQLSTAPAPMPILDEESETDRKLTKLAESAVNPTAQTAGVE